MADQVFEINEEDVITRIEDVPVIEERYKESSSLILTKEQVIIELTNLLYEEYKSSTQRRVEVYNSLLATHTPTPSHTYNPVMPTARMTRVLYYEDKEFNIDPEYENEQEVKYASFQSFLNQRYQLAKSGEPYTSTVTRLHRLMAPFLQSGTTPVTAPKDALRVLGSAVSLAPNRVLEGDVIDRVGFAVVAGPSSAPIATFDWQEYKAALSSLAAGASVVVYFNDFVFDGRGAITYKAAGRVSRVQEGILHIDAKGIDGTLRYDTRQPPTSMFVYTSDSHGTLFNKLMLLSSNIHFLGFSEEDVARYILPATFTELLFVLSNHSGTSLPASFSEINRITSLYGYDINMVPSSAHDVLRRVMARRYPAFKASRPSSVPFVSPNHFRGLLAFHHPMIDVIRTRFSDTDVYRYKILHDSLEAEHIRLCEVFKAFRERYKRALDAGGLQSSKKRLAGLLSRRQGSSSKPCGMKEPTSYTFAKVYNSLYHLREDNGRHAYYDASLDPTDYKAKAKHDGDEGRVREEVARKPGAKDIDFEVSAVMSGRRRIRPGDHCLLSTGEGDEVYVRRNIDGEHMWVKVTRLPFRVCAEDLVTISATEASKDTACVFDTYDSLCRTAKEMRENLAYNRNRQALDAIEAELAFLDGFDASTRIIDDDMSTSKSIAGLLKQGSHGVHIADDLIPSIDLEEYDGDLQQEGLQLEFQDQDRYEVMRPDGAQRPQKQAPQGPAEELLAMLCGFMDMPISPLDIQDISSKAAEYTSHHNINEKVQKERAKLERSINKQLYDTNEEYRRKVAKLVDDKVAAIETKMLSDIYYDTAVSTISRLSLAIMAKYPEMVVNSVYPSCVRFLTYMGYPLNQRNATRSISKYMCCMAKGITAGEDPRYQRIQDTTIDKLNEDVIAYTEALLDQDINLRLRVEANRAAIATKKARVPTKGHREFYGFRPEFDFGSRTTNRVAVMLKEMDSAVRDSRHLKVSMTNMPTLANSCCLEPLTDATYYTFFEQHQGFKDARRAATPRAKDQRPKKEPRVYISTTSAPVPQDIKQGVIAFARPGPAQRHPSTHAEDNNAILHAFLEANPTFTPPHPSKEDPAFADADWTRQAFWDDDIYNASNSMFESLRSIISRVDDGYNQPHMDMFRAIVAVRGISNSLSSVAFALRGFVCTSLPRTMSRLANRSTKAIGEKETEEGQLCRAFLEAQGADIPSVSSFIPKKLSSLVFSLEEGEEQDDVDIKCISLYVYIALKVVYSFVTAAITGRPLDRVDETAILRGLVGANTSKMDGISLACRLASYTIGAALSAISNNDVNVTDVRGRVEELREQKKQEIMALYRVDDEERQLQMALKKMGMKGWYDVGEMEQEAEPEKIDMLDMLKDNKRAKVGEEDANYRMDYPGENADADEVDEDHAPHAIFSADRE